MSNKMLDEASTIDEGATREYAAEVKTKSGTSNVFRIPDGSESYRKYYISWMQCDDDSIKPFIVENDTEGRGVLARLFGDQDNFFKGGYLESNKGQFGKVLKYQAKDPELFKRLTEYWNPAYNGPGTCKPKKEYIYNVLHRDPEIVDNQTLVWCDVNKHTKVIRFGAKAFKALAVVFENDGEFWDYDIIFSKKGTGSETTTTMMKAGKKTAHHRVGPLTAEEKTFERYDLDDVVRLPSAYYILKNLKNTIERIDAVMGTSFITELTEQLQIEQEVYNSRQAEFNQSNNTVVPNTVTPPNTPMANNPFNDAGIPFDAKQVPNQPPQPGQSVNIPQPQVQVQAQPQVPSPTPVSRVPINTATEKCGYCGAEIQIGLAACPHCKGILLTECDVCHNNFSAFSNICPHCSTQYKPQ